jgi:hypothetical protein
MNEETDPVLVRRERIRRWGGLAKTAGYLCFGSAMALFFGGFFLGFEDWIATTLTALLAVGSILLAPAIVLGYAVKAADREDRESRAD